MNKQEIPWNSLPGICSQNVELKAFINFIVKDSLLYSQETSFPCYLNFNDYIENSGICAYANQFLLSKEEKFKTVFDDSDKLIENLKELNGQASKKDVTKELLKLIKDDQTQQTLLFYLSGLFRLKVNSINPRNDTAYDKKYYEISLSDSENDAFVILTCTSSIFFRQYLKISLQPDHSDENKHDSNGVLETIELKGFYKVSIDLKVDGIHNIVGIVLLGFIIDGVKFQPDDKIKYFNLERLEYEKRDRYIKKGLCPLHLFKMCGKSSSYIDVEFLENNKNNGKHYQFHGFQYYGFKCNKLNDVIGWYNCRITKINWTDCTFNDVPFFDEKSSIEDEVNIDQTTLSHLNSGNFDALELTRLAEFLNRNHAYMEAQELHRGYLKAKAQSENNNSVKKGLIYLYDIINSCGTSLVQPFVWLFLLFGINWYLIRYAQPSPGTVNCIYEAIKNTFPFLKIYGSKEQTIDGGIGLLLNITAALATLILFLIAIHIRKLLKLRE